MHGHYPLAFEREMGCTEAELRAWLPGASRQLPMAWRAQGADVALDGGSAAIDWQPLAPRRIALIVLPPHGSASCATSISTPSAGAADRRRLSHLAKAGATKPLRHNQPRSERPLQP